jgi:8-oxo-dGTP pyrophosphatase MutT (NUDIX family)
MKPIQPHFDVSCAIIEKDGLILVAQRSEAMAMPLKWEFPGGKVEPDESAATCQLSRSSTSQTESPFRNSCLVMYFFALSNT